MYRSRSSRTALLKEEEVKAKRDTEVALEIQSELQQTHDYAKEREEIIRKLQETQHQLEKQSGSS